VSYTIFERTDVDLARLAGADTRKSESACLEFRRVGVGSVRCGSLGMIGVSTSREVV